MNDSSRTLIKRWLWGLGILVIFFVLAWKLEHLATLAILSFIVAYVLNPLVTRLSGIKFIGRAFATAITMFGLTVGFLTVLFFIIPEVFEEFSAFLGRLPALADKFQTTAIPWVESNLGVEVPGSWNEAYGHVLARVQKGGSEIIAPAAGIATKVFGTTFSAFFTIIGALMFPLFLFFLLKDFPKIVGAVDRLIPGRNRESIHSLASEVNKSLSAFLHGQFTVMLVLGALYSIGYSIVGVPVAIGVGLLTGLLCFIPYVGAASGFVLALLLAALEMKGWGSIVGVSIVFGVVQLLDAVLITPKILGGKLGLQPLWIIVALMAGGELFGFLGVLLAVPATAVLKIFVAHSIEKYKKSALFLSDSSTTNAETKPGGDPEE